MFLIFFPSLGFILEAAVSYVSLHERSILTGYLVQRLQVRQVLGCWA